MDSGRWFINLPFVPSLRNNPRLFQEILLYIRSANTMDQRDGRNDKDNGRNIVRSSEHMLRQEKK
ncbi:hypothetical protein RvY_09811 [Ramazzottius varieornatus]|uniref:Uncharacterized protein n=1 Tax=Ramazzottius varieornatus TaxID=947166 RepID=A0A1D1VG09_RAMVA|nr:hypothetical protein RvY_09811 [Ramazzottius varieornatus]